MRENKRGFSLVELIIVIAVIGILAGAVIIFLPGIIEKAHAKAALADAKNTLTMYMGSKGLPVEKNMVIAVEKYNKYYYFLLKNEEILPNENNWYERGSLTEACQKVSEIYPNVVNYTPINFKEKFNNVALMALYEELGGIVTVDAGMKYCIALDEQGRLWHWGGLSNDEYGTLPLPKHDSATLIESDVKFKSISATEYCFVALDTDGHMWVVGTWNTNDENYHQDWNLFGEGAELKYDELTMIFPDRTFSVVDCYDGVYYGNIIAIDTAGKLWIWGSNTCGQLGPDKNNYVYGHYREHMYDGKKYPGTSEPVNIMPDKTFTFAFTYDALQYAIDSEGNLWTWGNDVLYQGQGEKEYEWITTPILVQEGTKFVTANIGRAIDTEGFLWTWGPNSRGCGELGRGPELDDGCYTPEKILTEHRFIDCDILAVTTGNVAYVWGKADELGLEHPVYYITTPA